MISKLRFSLFAVILLVLLGFGFQNQAKGQPGEDDQFCPGVPFTTGYLDTEITRINPGGAPTADFSAALLGTVENFGGAAVGGLDWQHVDSTFDGAFGDNPTPTNEVGSQLISWWSQKDGRNTYLQVTNVDTGTVFPIVGVPFVPVHVRIYDEDCDEIRDFCDTYTPGDTHVYDFGNLIDNEGDDISDANLQGKEGFVIVTAVTGGCPDNDQAVAYNALAGTMYMLDSNDYLYGINTYARFGVCFFEDDNFFVNLIHNGSFQTGTFDPLVDWNIQQGQFFQTAGPVTSPEFAPPIPVPVCDDPTDPDCNDPDADTYMGVVLSDATVPFGFYGENAPLGSAADILQTNSLIGQGVETNVSIVQSNVFTPSGAPNPSFGFVLYDLINLAPNDLNFFCNNYSAVALINVTNPLAPFFASFQCFNRNGAGCFPVGDDNTIYALGSFEFQGGRSGLINGFVGPVATGQSYVVQFISGQLFDQGCSSPGFPRTTNGALVDNFRFIEELAEPIGCFDGILTGSDFAYLASVIPDRFAGQFNVQDTLAGADAVLINFADQYSPDYRALPAFINADIQIFDEFETPESCGDINVCFIRLGIDANLPISEDFTPVTPTPTPGTPTPTPTPGTPTPTPTPTGGGGGSSGCAIAASPIHLGTAMANVLIPLIPVAFAFGIGAVRRRRKK